MMDSTNERFIRRTLRKLARQRVGMILQPGNIWVIERTPPRNEHTEAALRTCHLRGWVEVVEEAVPTGSLTPDGRLPEGPPFSGVAPIYRITEAGWNTINRTHTWVLIACAIAFASFLAGVAGAVIAF